MRTFEEAHALVIGVADYNSRAFPQLSLAALNDAVDFACTLWNPRIGAYRSDRVRLLLNEQATAPSILQELERIIEDSTDRDTVVLFFSGHGWHENGSSYLAAWDAHADGGPLDGLISGETLSNYLQAIPARRVAAFFDCCYSGGVAEIESCAASSRPMPATTLGLDEATYERIARGEGRAVFASSKPGGRSIIQADARNSIFTSCLLRALHGEAQGEDPDTIRILDIFRFLNKEVLVQSCGLQRPILKTAITDDFPLVLRQRREQQEAPIPSPTPPPVGERFNDWSQQAHGDIHNLFFQES